MNFISSDPVSVRKRAEEYFEAALSERAALVDRMMAWLLGAEWLGMMGAALIISPRVWNGTHSGVHPHVWAAILAGPAFILPVIVIALLCPARQLTRHAIAAAQILVSILLIDCTGGRIETHFHIFGSLAFLAFYQDWRVLATASAITAADHFARGVWWPQSVYGVITVSPWRWVEHAWWVLFEDFFLVAGARNSLRDMRTAAISKARLYDGASHDVLTGLPNRRLLQEKFGEWAGAAGNGSAALLFIDLDGFKHANDTLGHTIGDKLLALTAPRFAGVVGPAGIVARIGGDEFVALVRHVSGMAEAKSLGERLLGSLATPFRVDGNQLLLTASIGISLYPEHGNTLAVLQERADRAMYVAKAQGRNRCVAFSTEVARREEFVLEISRDLPTAFERGEFHVHYQPLIRRDGQLTGFEALLRWRHRVHGTVGPAEFIQLAEKSGLIISLGEWVLEEACRECLTWQISGQGPVSVAVNVSVVQFDEPDYPDRVFATLARCGLDPRQLTLELTEGVLVRDIGRARAHLTRLRLAGIRIALDDFGTGYSSLSYLTDLPADVIKLDRTFLNRAAPESSMIIESIVNLAHRLGLQVVAEGVETQTQLEGLLNLQCDQFQGFYFSKPVSADAATEFLGLRAEETAAGGRQIVEELSSSN